jgi:hypothetical protein
MMNVGVSKENGFIKLLKMVRRFGGNGSYIAFQKMLFIVFPVYFFQIITRLGHLHFGTVAFPIGNI